MSIWVVCAASAQARIFSVTDAGTLTEFRTLVHPESRNRNRELVSDRPGRGSTTSGRRHTIGHEDQPSEVQAQNFANELSTFLNGAFRKGRINGLHLVAAPAFLGLLRARLDPALLESLKSETAANLTTMSVEHIRAHLPQRLSSSKG
jgi:protein required for attachment to host cells